MGSVAIVALASPFLLFGQPELTIERTQFAYGVHWDERPSVFYPNDQGAVRFVVAGLKRNERGHVSLLVSTKIVTRSGLVVAENAGTPQTYWVDKETSRCFQAMGVKFSNDLLPGDYEYHATIKDLASGREGRFIKSFTIAPESLSFRLIGYYAEPDRKTPVSPIIRVGQPIVVAANLMGFDKAIGSIDVSTRITLIPVPKNSTPDREPAISDNLQTMKKNDPKEVQATDIVFSGGVFVMTSPGEYRISISATDNNSGKQARCDAKIIVMLP
jgi:hypothetical protein